MTDDGGQRAEVGRKETVICYWLIVICLSGMRKSIAEWEKIEALEFGMGNAASGP